MSPGVLSGLHRASGPTAAVSTGDGQPGEDMYRAVRRIGWSAMIVFAIMLTIWWHNG